MKGRFAMAQGAATQHGMTLFTTAGERKYLSGAERKRFYDALSVLNEPTDRTFCELLFWTGCRPSEALALTAMHIDVDDAMVVIRSLRKRGESKGRHFRAIPVPREFMDRLNRTHYIHAKQSFRTGGEYQLLWPMGRTTAWKRVRQVMNEAGISGARACAKGLRHTYGVHAALSNVPETRIKKWLGHASLSTTEIYLDMASPEDRSIARRMWPGNA